MVTVVIVGIITAAVTRAYIAGAEYPQRLKASREDEEVRRSFEDRLSAILKKAYLTNDAADLASYFIGTVGTEGGFGAGGFADTVVLTTAGTRIPSNLLNSLDDFETNNQRFGPIGGVTEISISSTPVGAPGDRQGLFIREQPAADGDPTQGGFESVLSSEVSQIQFEFFDGAVWVQEWDTRTMGTRRLPAAVRVVYRFNGEDQDRVMVVRLPNSDVTPEDPVVEGEA